MRLPPRLNSATKSHQKGSEELGVDDELGGALPALVVEVSGLESTQT